MKARQRMALTAFAIAAFLMLGSPVVANAQTAEQEVTMITIHFQREGNDSGDGGHSYYVQNAENVLAGWIAYLDGATQSKRLWFKTFGKDGTPAGEVVINLDTVTMIEFEG